MHFCITIEYENEKRGKNAVEQKQERLIKDVASMLLEGAHMPRLEKMCGMKHQIALAITLARQGMYPEVFGNGECCEKQTTHNALKELYHSLLALIEMAIRTSGSPLKNKEKELCERFIQELPHIKAILETDIEAAYLGDPAATSKAEILLAYPSFEAVSVYRMAHTLYTLGVPLLPRMMTEYAHQHTGIDIHPGAKIGTHFFIDHGTGVVIGETAVIGNHVKIYQGVTLGAKSFPTDENGNPIKGIQRHPTLGNGVIVYAGATILGGDTIIGDGAVIGGNVWLTHSVAKGEIITNIPHATKTKPSQK